MTTDYGRSPTGSGFRPFGSSLQAVSPVPASIPNAVLVCGGREYNDAAHVNSVLDAIHRHKPIACIIQGGAAGADTLATQWARERSVTCHTYRANWNKHGRGAGPIRNQQMIDHGKPALVVAFPGGRGTADMVRRAEEAGIQLVEYVSASGIETAEAAETCNRLSPKGESPTAESGDAQTPSKG